MIAKYTKEFIESHVSEMKLTYVQKIQASERIKVMSSRDCFDVISPFWDDDINIQESFVVVCLNRANMVIGAKTISKGNATGTIVCPKLVFTYALLSGASSIIIAHNHPSGSLIPSDSDNEITKKLVATSKFLDIHVLDHLIISPEGKYYSFADEGNM